MTRSPLADPRIKAYIEMTAGENGLQVAKLLQELGEATDTDIAERLGEKPSHVRKILYDLYEARLAEYYQKKDKETGWQTFHWKLSPENALRTIELHRKKQLEALEAKLKDEEENQFFACKKHPEPRFGFDAATDANFVCPTCGSPLEEQDKRAIVAQLKQQIADLKKALAA